MTLQELMQAVDHLAATDQWQLVRHVLETLEHQATPSGDYRQFLRETYGALRDTPIRRWEQGEYEAREPLE